MHVKRSGYADSHEVAFTDTGEISGSLDHIIVHELLQILVHHVTDVVLAAIDHVDLLGLHVDAHGLEAGLGLLHGKGQAHVAETHGAAHQIARGDLVQQLLLRSLFLLGNVLNDLNEVVRMADKRVQLGSAARVLSPPFQRIPVRQHLRNPPSENPRAPENDSSMPQSYLLITEKSEGRLESTGRPLAR